MGRLSLCLIALLLAASSRAATVLLRGGRSISDIEQVERLEDRGQLKIVRRDGFVLYVDLDRVLEVRPDALDRVESTPPPEAPEPEPPKGLVENLEEYRRRHPDFQGGDFSAPTTPPEGNAAAAASGGEESYWRSRAEEISERIQGLHNQIEQATEEYNQLARQHNSSGDPVQRSVLRGQLDSISEQRRGLEADLQRAQADQRQLRFDAESAGVPLEWLEKPSEQPETTEPAPEENPNPEQSTAGS